MGEGCRFSLLKMFVSRLHVNLKGKRMNGGGREGVGRRGSERENEWRIKLNFSLKS
jgi:hypothetical protein